VRNKYVKRCLCARTHQSLRIIFIPARRSSLLDAAGLKPSAAFRETDASTCACGRDTFIQCPFQVRFPPCVCVYQNPYMTVQGKQSLFVTLQLCLSSFWDSQPGSAPCRPLSPVKKQTERVRGWKGGEGEFSIEKKKYLTMLVLLAWRNPID